MTSEGRKVFNIVIAVLVAIGSWAFVVINYKPMTEVTYNDVPITYSGLVTLANRGYAVSGANHDTVNVTLQQKRVDTGSISAENIFVTADVSNLSSGEDVVALDVTAPDGTTVQDVSLKTVTLEIESATSETRPISFEYNDEAGEDEVPIITDASVETADVIATEDKLDQIDRIAAVIDPKEIGSKRRLLTARLVALDSENNEVINVFIDPETVSFRAASGSTKSVDLTVPVKDESDDSYSRTYTVPDTITVKGRKDAMELVTGIKAKETDITYIYENSEIPLELELPDGVFVDDADMPVIKVTVTEKKEDNDDQ
ncbi:MAG: hypothetical protein IJ227_04635 [Mogibacterium sp.]|nr:hypothetical protein [Mogibacterium sp.]